jgi:ATP-binding cassette subfamily B multidrug efflux pump
MINRVDQEEEAVERPFDMGMSIRLMRYVRPYPRLLWLSGITILIGTGALLAIPFLTGYAIQHFVAAKNYTGLVGLVVVMSAIYAVRYFAYKTQTFVASKLGQEILRDLRSELFHHIQKLNFSFFDRIAGGKIITRVVGDVQNLQQLLSQGIVNTIANVVLLIGIVIAMILLKWNLALASFIIVPIMFFLSTNFRRRMVERWRVVRRRNSIVNATWAESLNGARVVIAYGREDHDRHHFMDLAWGYFRSFMAAERLSSLFTPIVNFAGTVGTGIVFWYGAMLYLHHAVTLGVLISFILYLGMFWQPISQLGQFYNQVLMAMASAERVFEYLDQAPQVVDRADAKPLDMKGEVTFDHVVFQYQPNRPVLRDISFHVNPGETIALVGSTGAGKSSILSILPRFYDVVGGRILVDGVDIRDVQLRSIRRQVALVLQETFIFDGTIRENIRYGRPEATDAEVEKAARAAQAHHFIAELPQTYDTPVRERGSRLSLGQRQLLAFARAILADPRILILDEATASIDTQTELLVQEGLKRLLTGRTAFVAAHRLSTIREADRILVIDQGRLVESGTHAELMAKHGHYYRFLEAQFKLEDNGGWFGHDALVEPVS